MRYIFLVLLFVLFSNSSAFSADFSESDSDICKIRLDGEIIEGDFQRFISMASVHFQGAENSESTANDTICLNSPGGSVSEGIRLAAAFQKLGVGTRIAERDGCYSICAIMFMMGQAQGSEVKFVNRQMHISAQLGFHRPYMLLESPKLVSARVLPVAYNVALENLTEIMILATSRSPWSNIPMIKPDLVQLMLQHIGDDLFLIDTVEKAGRFDIEVFGYEVPATVTEDQLFYACENTFHWQVGLIGEETDYDKTKANNAKYGGSPPVVLEYHLGDTSIYKVTSDDMGYSDAQCIMRVDNDAISACGYNEMYNVRIGEGACLAQEIGTKAEYIDDLARFKPTRKLSSLPETGNKVIQTTKEKINFGICFVYYGSEKLDEEICKIEIEKASQITKYSFLWPSGSRTILQHGANKILINGVDARIIDNKNFDICTVNLKTMKMFCFRR